MCGIAGVVGPGLGVDDEQEVQRATSCLVHRGPDRGAVRCFDGAVLGHRRLRIIDLTEAADQPMPNEDGSVQVVFNGEIYNFPELRAELAAAGHRFRSESDTEVIVHLYEEVGPAFVSRLRGMFALALYDIGRKRVVLARDPLGIKPLYLRRDRSGDRLWFASEVRALRRPGDRIDSTAVNDYCRLGWVPRTRSIIAGIEDLRPGHVLVHEPSGERVIRYWAPPFGEPETGNDHLPTVLQDSVRRHLVADVPVGVFLSSGVDSGVVAALAARASRQLKAFTVSFTGLPGDETVAAAQRARELGLEHVVVPVSADVVVQRFDKLVGAFDQPSVDGVNSWIVSGAVHEAGAVVALSGVGGDELFRGYSTFRHIPRLVRIGERWGSLPTWARGLSDRHLGWSERLRHTRARRAASAVFTADWMDAYAAVRGLCSAAELAVLRPDVESTPPALTDPVGAPASGPDRVAAIEISNYLTDQLLRDTDAMSMQHSLEVRVPLVDQRVVESSLRGAEGREDWSKRQLVAATPMLTNLIDAPKQTFTLPFDTWMQEGLRSTVMDGLFSLGEADLGFDRRAVTGLWDAYLAGRAGWRTVWGLAVLGWWHDRNLRGPR